MPSDAPAREVRFITLHKDFSESVSVSGGATGPSPPPANSPGQFSTLVRVTVPKSRTYTFKHMSDLVLKLYRTAANGAGQVSGASELLFAYKMPTMAVPSDIMGRKLYSPWANIPIDPTGSAGKTQYDDETKSARRIYFKPGRDIELPQDHIMELLFKGASTGVGVADVVDWANANTLFEWTIAESDVQTQVAV